MRHGLSVCLSHIYIYVLFVVFVGFFLYVSLCCRSLPCFALLACCVYVCVVNCLLVFSLSLSLSLFVCLSVSLSPGLSVCLSLFLCV